MTEPTATPPHRRLGSLDALRGIAVFLMVEQHVGVWLWRGLGRGESLADYAPLVGFNAIGGFGGPLFFALAGVGSALLAEAKGRAADAILVRRGLIVMGFGYVMNLLTPSWFSWGSFFALHLIGFGMLLAPLWRRLGVRGVLAVMLCVIAVTPLVQAWLDTPLRLANPRMRDLSHPGGPFRLALAESQYPILPWLSVYLAGFAGGLWIRRGQPGRVALLGAVALLAGGVGVLVYQAIGRGAPELVTRAFKVGIGWFPCSSSMVSLMLGLCMLLVAGGIALERRRPLGPYHPMVTLGRASLTIFMVHLPLFRELSRPVGAWGSLEAGATLGVIFGFLALCVVLTMAWRRHDFRYGAEWVLRKLGG